MRNNTGKTVSLVVLIGLIMVPLINGAGPFFLPRVAAAELQSRTLQLSDSLAGNKGVTYNAAFQIATSGNLGSIEFEFCSNSTFPSDICIAPNGMDASGAVFSQESGISGFSLYSRSANDIIIARPPAPTLQVSAKVQFDNITNPTNNGSYYLRVLTYPTNDGSGAPTDTGGMAFAIANAVNVSATVPPYLLFCTGNSIAGTDCSSASGNFIELGALSAGRTSSGQSQMLASTNAKNGYSLYVTGNTLTSGNNTIPALTVDSPSQAGVSQFGINLRANSIPTVGANTTGAGLGAPTINYDQPNQFRFLDNDVIASSSTADDYRKYTVSYIVNISKAQPPGVYAGTFTYVALGNF